MLAIACFDCLSSLVRYLILKVGLFWSAIVLIIGNLVTPTIGPFGPVS